MMCLVTYRSCICQTCYKSCLGEYGTVLYNDCFFFKQKTAYEMRISDWSSDVCSSDLTSSCPSTPKPSGTAAWWQDWTGTSSPPPAEYSPGTAAPADRKSVV